MHGRLANLPGAASPAVTGLAPAAAARTGRVSGSGAAGLLVTVTNTATWAGIRMPTTVAEGPGRAE
ncbi:MAG: hypothetical protein FWJ90_20395 [Actinomadura sp.]